MKLKDLLVEVVNIKGKKKKKNFSMCMNKLLVSALVTGSLLSVITPVYADSFTDKVEGLQKVEPTKKYVKEIKEDVKASDIFTFTENLKQRKKEGALASKDLYELSDKITVLGRKDMSDIKRATILVDSINNLIEDINIKGVSRVEAALEILKSNLGLFTKVEMEDYKAPPAPVTLTDIENHWGKQNISKLVNLGGINGYPDNTFKPEKTISFAEFLKIAVSSKVPVEEIKVVPNSHWVQGVYETAVEKGIITPQEFSADEDTFNAPITREDMALILVRINELNNTKVDTTSVDTLIKDYSNISELRRYYVKQAYKKGLLKGKGGTFDPQGSLKRAEAATAVVNMLEYKPGQEIEIEVKEEIVEGREIDITDPNRPTVIKEGDVIIKADGTKVVLKKGDAGVLGQGQGVDYWSGVKFPNGEELQEGKLGGFGFESDSKGCHWKHGYAGQPYAVDKDVVAQYDYEEAGKQYKKGDLIRKGTGEGHFRDDWYAIGDAEMALAMKLYPTPPKEPTWVGEYTYFDGDSWSWTGPF